MELYGKINIYDYVYYVSKWRSIMIKILKKSMVFLMTCMVMTLPVVTTLAYAEEEEKVNIQKMIEKGLDLE